MNLREFFSSIGRALVEIVGTAPVGTTPVGTTPAETTKSENAVTIDSSDVEKQESGYRKELEKRVDYSQQVEDKKIGKGKREGKTEKYKADVQARTRQTSRQTGRTSQENTNKGYERE